MATTMLRRRTIDTFAVRSAALGDLPATEILETIREPLLVLDAALHVQFANLGFLTTFELKPAAVLGRSLFALDDGQWDLPVLRHLLKRVLPGDKEVRDYRFEQARENSGPRIVVLNASRVTRPEGDSAWILLALEDITERVAARHALEQLSAELEQRVAERTAELVAAAEELEAFSYSVSHDLRAPLRAIDGYSRILVEDFAAALPEPAPRFLHQIRASAQTMGQLIDDLLRFSRLSRKPLTARLINPAGVAHRAWAELAPEQTDRLVEFQVDHLPECDADPALLKQVFVNLLSNALKFTRGRAPAQITVRGERVGAEVCYTVADNGVGFDMQYADKLFGVFQRLHRAEAFEGTGVGLAIVQRIVLRHGGRVWAASELAKGASFSFALPEGTVHE